MAEGAKAWREPDGTYAIYGRTYENRALIRQLGGKWDAEKRCWRGLTRDAARRVAAVMVRARCEAYCHEPEAEIWVTEKELEDGVLRRPFCGLCDAFKPCKPRLWPLEE